MHLPCKCTNIRVFSKMIQRNKEVKIICLSNDNDDDHTTNIIVIIIVINSVEMTFVICDTYTASIFSRIAINYLYTI